MRSWVDQVARRLLLALSGVVERGEVVKLKVPAVLSVPHNPFHAVAVIATITLAQIIARIVKGGG